MFPNKGRLYSLYSENTKVFWRLLGLTDDHKWSKRFFLLSIPLYVVLVHQTKKLEETLHQKELLEDQRKYERDQELLKNLEMNSKHQEMLLKMKETEHKMELVLNSSKPFLVNNENLNSNNNIRNNTNNDHELERSEDNLQRKSMDSKDKSLSLSVAQDGVRSSSTSPLNDAR